MNPRRSRSRRTSRSGSGGVGVLDGGGGGAARRQPRPVYKTPRRMFRQLGVVSNAIADTITGDIDAIDSPGGEYTAFFMTTDRGPTMVVSHAGTPDRAAGEEMAGDLRQVHGEGADGTVPSSLVIHVDRGQEEAGREAARSLLDRINADRVDGGQLQLREGAPDATPGNTIGLSFSLVGTGDDVAPVGGDQPAGDGLRPGDGQPPNDGPPPPDPLVNAAPAGPAPLADDADADLRSARNRPPLPDVDAFRQATRERSLRGRTPAYERMVTSLETYHREMTADLAEYALAASALRTEITAIGRTRASEVETLIGLRAQLRANEQESVIAQHESVQAMDRYFDDLTGDAPAASEAARQENERVMSEQLRRLTAANVEVVRLQGEIRRVEGVIGQFDNRIVDGMRRSKDLARTHQERLERRGPQVVDAAKAYLDTKKHSDTDTKQAAVRELINGASDPVQYLQRITEVSGMIWSSEFRHQLDGPTEVLNTGTASDVFRVETIGSIGESGQRVGFAKRALVEGQPANPATQNLGIGEQLTLGGAVLTERPNLIARQVVSSRIDRYLGTNVLADEVFSSDTDGRTIGVTALADGKQARKDVPVPMTMVDDPNGGVRVNDKVTVFAEYNLREAEVQKNLSNLQIMDALTGQLDRHVGNIFITRDGKVTGIDNDMAFSRESADFTTSNTLITFDRATDGKLTYLNDQIDHETAARILDPSFAERFEAMIRGQEGDPERLGDEEVRHALTRLEAIQAKALKLRSEGRLIGGPNRRQWGTTTYNEALTGIRDRGGFGEADHLNYVVRLQRSYDNAGAANDPTMRQDVQGD